MKHIAILTLLLTLSLYLGMYNENVALYDSNNPAPLQVFPYPVSLLPKADQEALKSGIRVSSKEELLQLIEDYFS